MYGFLSPPSLRYKGRALVDDLFSGARSHGLKCKKFARYEPCDTLVLYGVGGSDRLGVAMKHVKKGGTLITFDAGYWDRTISLTKRMYRVSLNEFHPQKYIMLGEPPDQRRFQRFNLRVTDKHNPDGPIMLVGNGPKSQAVWADGWTRAKSLELRNLFPGKKILYRPKPKRPDEKGISYDAISRGKIDSELQKCSLVVCRHSNVAVDACRVGVPVVCEDGAAAAIYPSAYDGRQPDIETRKEFLNRLAYWQWSREEIKSGQFWSWMDGLQRTIQAHGL